MFDQKLVRFVNWKIPQLASFMMKPDPATNLSWARLFSAGLLFVLLIGLVPKPLFAQNEPTHFRDLGKTLGPQELVRRLRRFQASPREETALFSELEKLGEDIFDSLSPEERTNARKFAEQLIRNKGIDSDEVKGLMDRMGVDAAMQKRLAEQFKESGLQSRLPKEFKDLSYDEMRSGSWDRDRFQRELDKAGVGDELRRLINPSMFGPDGENQSPGIQPADPNARTNADSMRPPLQDPANPSSSASPRSPADDPFLNGSEGMGAKGRGDDDIGSKGSSAEPKGVDRPLATGRNRDPAIRSDDSTDRTRSQTQNLRSKSLPELRRERAQNLERLRAAAKARQNSLQGEKDFLDLMEMQRQLDDSINSKSQTSSRAGNPSTPNSMSNRNNKTPNSSTPIKSPSVSEDLSKLSNKEWAKKFAEVAKEVVPKLDQSQQRSGDVASNLFSGDALKTLQKFKDGIKSNLTPDKSENLGGLLENSKNFLSRAAGQKRAEKVEAQFDRLLFETAKATMKAANEDDDSMFGEAINSVIESSVDVVKDGVKSSRKAKRDAERRARDSQGDWEPPSFDDEDMSSIMNNLANRSPDEQSNSRNGLWNRDSDQGSGSSTSLFGGSGSSRESSASSAMSSLESPIEAVAGMFNAQTLILLVMGILIIAALAYMLVKFIPEDTPEARQKQLANKLKNVAVRDASDLVDAVDLYLLAHHGNGSNWWHAEMAKEVVEAEKPQLKDRIRKLFDVYVVSRYTDAKSAITSQEKELAESTLKQLSQVALEESKKESSVVAQVSSGDA